MNYLRLKSINELFAFFAASRSAGLPPGAFQVKFQHPIYVETGMAGQAVSYCVELTEDGAQALKPLFGKQVQKGDPEQKSKKIFLNELFHQIPLLHTVDERLSLPNLVLAIPYSPERAGHDKMLDKLRALSEKIPKQESAESHYFLTQPAPWGEKQPALCVRGVEILGVDQQRFDYKNLGDELGREVKLFTPAWEDSECHFYVEWGYTYPKAQEFRVYHEQTRRQTDGDEQTPRHTLNSRPLLLATAGEPLERRDGSRWHKSTWHQLARPSYREEQSLFDQLELQVGGVTKLEALAVDTPLKLAIKPTSNAIDQAEDAEKRIWECERQLEELRSLRARSHEYTRREHLPLYLWVQDQQDSAGLPKELETFLLRSRGELLNYDYVALRDEKNASILHFLAGQTPVTPGTALGVKCHHRFFCDNRWKEWGLPVYVAADCALSLSVDEEEIAIKFIERLQILFEREGQQLSRDDVVIADRSDESDGVDTNLYFKLLPKHQMKAAAHCLEFIGAFGSGPGEIVQASGDYAALSAVSHQVKAPELAVNLAELLRDRAGVFVQELQDHWETLRVSYQTKRLEMLLTQTAVELSHQAYTQHPAHWRQFVDTILDTDKKIAALKLTELGHWNDNSAERTKRLADTQQSNLDVRELISTTTADFNRRADLLEQDIEATDATIVHLVAAHARVDEAATKLTTVQTQLRSLQDVIEQRKRALSNELAAYKQAREIYDRDRQEFDPPAGEWENRLANLRAQTADLHAQAESLEQRRNEWLEEQVRHQEAQAAVEQERQTLAQMQAGELETEPLPRPTASVRRPLAPQSPAEDVSTRWNEPPAVRPSPQAPLGAPKNLDRNKAKLSSPSSAVPEKKAKGGWFSRWFSR